MTNEQQEIQRKLLTLHPRWKNFKVDTSGCWLWLGGTSKNNTDRRASLGNKLVYRVIWEHIYGPIKGGLFCCHKCDNGLCVNPQHIFLGTQKENLADAKRKGHKLGRPKRKLWATDRILELHKKGYTNYRIEKETGIDHTTVKRHIKMWLED